MTTDFFANPNTCEHAAKVAVAVAVSLGPGYVAIVCLACGTVRDARREGARW